MNTETITASPSDTAEAPVRPDQTQERLLLRRIANGGRTPTDTVDASHAVVIIGGGAAGIAVASSLKARKPDFDLPDDLEASSRMGQVVRLNEAVAMSIAVYTRPGSYLATKGRKLDSMGQ